MQIEHTEKGHEILALDTVGVNLAICITGDKFLSNALLDGGLDDALATVRLDGNVVEPGEAAE